MLRKAAVAIAACVLIRASSSFLLTPGVIDHRRTGFFRGAVTEPSFPPIYKSTTMALGAASEAADMEQLRFLTAEQTRDVRSLVGTPAYVYNVASLKRNAAAALAFPNAYGLTARFAMKASPNAAILKLFAAQGLQFDASSTFEVRRAMAAGIPPSSCSLSTQELSPDFAELISQGLTMNACSLSQLRAFGEAFPGGEVGVRFNPGLGSGGTGKTNVGGPSSSFGIWHEHAEEVAAIAAEYKLKIMRVHTHIGSGSNPAVWQRVAGMSLDLVRRFPDVKTLNLGGGYKVGRMAGEQSTDLKVVGVPVVEAFEAFAKETGRELHLEIEPGTFLLANAGSVVTSVQDKVTTGTAEGHTFLKLDAGMTDVLRPSLYGAQHPLVVVKATSDADATSNMEPVVVVGHCCESGDLLTCAPDEPETIDERVLTTADVGDLLVIEGSGAYCSAMSTKNYNSFPEAPEVLLDESGKLHVARKRQRLEQIWENEVDVPSDVIAC